MIFNCFKISCLLFTCTCNCISTIQVSKHLYFSAIFILSIKSYNYFEENASCKTGWTLCISCSLICNHYMNRKTCHSYLPFLSVYQLYFHFTNLFSYQVQEDYTYCLFTDILVHNIRALIIFYLKPIEAEMFTRVHDTDLILTC